MARAAVVSDGGLDQVSRTVELMQVPQVRPALRLALGENALPHFHLCLPDGRVYGNFSSGDIHPPLGADGRPRTLGAGPISFELIEPFRHWRIRYDGDVVWRQDVPDPNPPDVSHSLRHDHFNHYRFCVPVIPPGAYTLRVTVKDLPTGRVAQRTVDMRVTARSAGGL